MAINGHCHDHPYFAAGETEAVESEFQPGHSPPSPHSETPLALSREAFHLPDISPHSEIQIFPSALRSLQDMRVATFPPGPPLPLAFDVPPDPDMTLSSGICHLSSSVKPLAAFWYSSFKASFKYHLLKEAFRDPPHCAYNLHTCWYGSLCLTVSCSVPRGPFFSMKTPQSRRVCHTSCNAVRAH